MPFDLSYYAEQDRSFENNAYVADVDTGSWTTILSKTLPVNRIYFLTDINFTASENGAIRMKVDTEVICNKIYGARSHMNLSRRIPIKVPGNATFKIEFKPDVDNSQATAGVAGYWKDD